MVISFHIRFGRPVLIGTALAALSACTNTVATTATTLEFGVPPGQTLPTATYDEATDTYTVTDGTNTATLARDAGLDAGGFAAYVAPFDGYVWRAVSPSGDLIAVFQAARPSGTGDYSIGGELARMNDATIPTGGTASYTGSYGGNIQEGTSPFTPRLLIEGDAALMADFDTATVSGAITNRLASGNPMADLTLDSGTIGANGSFDGSATGGEYIPGAGNTTSGGAYSGLFGGTDAAEVAAGVSLKHVIAGIDYIETGAFIATQ